MTFSRITSFSLALTGIFLGCGWVVADEPSYRAEVVVPTLDARCLPSEKAGTYVTNRLNQGDVVEVVGETPEGWLAIRPPEGSFSWINMAFVERINDNMRNYKVTVTTTRAPVLVGSKISPGKPTREGSYLATGAQVRAIGDPKTDSDGVWLPIEPPAKEVRYIPMAGVRKVSPGTPPGKVIETASAQEQRPVQISMTTATTTTTPQVDNSRIPWLWNQAVTAEREGQFADAYHLYTKVGAEGMQSHRNLAMTALSRAHWLKTTRGLHNARSLPPQPGRPTSTASTPAGSTLSNPVSTFNPQRPQGQRYTSGPGILRRCGHTLLKRATYVLELTDHYPHLLYVTPGQGLDLESYVDQKVELIGPSWYSGELRNNYMVADQVRPLR